MARSNTKFSLTPKGNGKSGLSHVTLVQGNSLLPTTTGRKPGKDDNSAKYMDE